jgi:hypothetical protein
MGVWRTLGYIFGGLTIVAGFILIGSGANLSTQTSFETGLYGNMLSQFGGLALVYGGVNTVVFGILIIWALVKSGQIDSIEKNIKIIAEWTQSRKVNEGNAEWTQSQKVKEGNADDYERFFEDQQRKLRPK